jgi:hypothetical protein
MFEDIMEIFGGRGFGGMSAENYDDRKIGRWDSEDGESMVSTAEVTDGRKPYETAVQTPDYNDGQMIIVECYDDKEDAKLGHEKWLAMVLEDKLPLVLTDCCNASISQRISDTGGTMTFGKRNKRE